MHGERLPRFYYPQVLSELEWALDISPSRRLYVDATHGQSQAQGRGWEQAFSTVGAAIAAADPWDRILIAPGEYDEAVVVPEEAPHNLVLMGMGGRGSVFLAPSAANAVALTVSRADDIMLLNVGCEGNGTGGGLHVQGTRRFRAIGCKLEGGAFASKLESLAARSLADTRLEDCELAWTATALHLIVTGGGDPVTQTYLRRCLLHNYTSRGVHVDTVQAADLWLDGNTFGRQEDGSEPTNEYVLAVAGTTGFLSRNAFPAAIATAKISVATGVIRSGNVYTDGIGG